MSQKRLGPKKLGKKSLPFKRKEVKEVVKSACLLALSTQYDGEQALQHTTAAIFELYKTNYYHALLSYFWPKDSEIMYISHTRPCPKLVTSVRLDWSTRINYIVQGWFGWNSGQCKYANLHQSWRLGSIPSLMNNEMMWNRSKIILHSMRWSHTCVLPFTFSQETFHKLTAIDIKIKTYKGKPNRTVVHRRMYSIQCLLFLSSASKFDVLQYPPVHSFISWMQWEPVPPCLNQFLRNCFGA